MLVCWMQFFGGVQRLKFQTWEVITVVTSRNKELKNYLKGLIFIQYFGAIPRNRTQKLLNYGSKVSLKNKSPSHKHLQLTFVMSQRCQYVQRSSSWHAKGKVWWLSKKAFIFFLRSELCCLVLNKSYQENFEFFILKDKESYHTIYKYWNDERFSGANQAN